MTAKERLVNATQKAQKLTDRFNAIEAEKQDLLKEVLRLEGEIRLLQELIKEESV
jgi:predicted  nucleic acid-binding Zn-ribbon protein